MSKSVRRNLPLGLFLQTIVANCRSCLHGRFYVARLERIPFLVGVIRPYAGETVGLQFNPHLDTVCFRLAARCTLRSSRPAPSARHCPMACSTFERWL